MRTILSRVTATVLFLLSSLSITANTDPFSFATITNATPSTLITSNIATITGFDSTISIGIEGGSYTIGNSAPTATEGAITSGATVAVLVLSSSEFNTQTVATLTVGSGASATRAIFSVTTRLDPAITPNSITLTLSATTTIADNTITVTVSASNSSGAIDIAELVATVVLAGAAVSTNGNEITYTPSAAGNETISVISINGIDVSGISGSSATFEVTHGALTRIELEPQNPTFLVNGVDTTGVTITVTLYDANNNLVLTDTAIRFAALGGGGFETKNGRALSGTGTVEVLESEQRTGIVTIVAGGISATTTVTAIEITDIGFTGVSDTDADSPITITISASNTDGAVDISELVATVVLAGAAVSTNGNEITYTPSAAGSETISVISINGADASSLSGNSATFSVFHGALARIGLEPQNPTFIVDGTNLSSITIDITLYDANNNLILAETEVSVDISDFGNTNLDTISGGTATISIRNSRQETSVLIVSAGGISATTTVTAAEIANIGFTGIGNTNTNSPIIITISVTDSVGDAIDISELVATVVLAGAAVSIEGNQITYTPSVAGTEIISITSINGVDVSSFGGSSAMFNVVAPASLGAPVFTSVPITSVRVGNLYRYSLSASDDYGSNLIFGVVPETSLPSWLAIIDAFVTTLAGDGLAGNDNGPTSTASFNLPIGVVIDASGNIVVADRNNHRIRGITSDGTVTTIAGSSVGVADGASATAEFDQPTGVAIDASGNIIVASGSRIRSIGTNAVVSTIAGGTERTFIDGASATARFRSPISVAIDASGNIIIADRGNNRIRSLTLDGTVTTVAGGDSAGSTNGASATARFSDPADVAIDASGDIIVADRGNQRIRRISADGTVTTIAGRDAGSTDGASSTAMFNSPTAVAVDAFGNIIVADRGNNRIRSIAPDGTVSTIAGSGLGSTDGASGTAMFRFPTGVAVDALGNIVVADGSNNRIRKIDRNNLIGTPSCGDIGVYDLDLIVSDGEQQDLQSFTIRVTSDGSCILVAPFSFDTITNAALGSTITSVAITVATNTLDPQSTFTISIEGDDARYSINDGGYTNTGGVVSIGDSVRVQIVASSELNTTKTATINIDNIAAAFTIATIAEFLTIVDGNRVISYGADDFILVARGGVDADNATWTSSVPSVATIDENSGSVTIIGVGITTITARSGDDETTISISVTPITLSPTFVGESTFVYDTNIRTVLATITSGIVGADDISLSISGATATDVGNYNINLALIGASSLNYRLSTTTLSWSITKADQTGFAIIVSSTLELETTTTATTGGGQGTGAISFVSGNPAIATIDQNGIVTARELGTTTISATRAGGNNYNDISASALLTVVDTTPDPFSFTAITNAETNTFITSNIAIITGFDSTVSISVEGGSYIIGANPPTTADGIITAGATVAVQVLSSSEFNTQTIATLTIGSGVGLTRAIFSVTTERIPEFITLILSASNTTADNPITITISASDAEGVIDIDELVATVVLAGASILIDGNEITYTPSTVGSEIISITSINGINVSGIIGSSATFDVTHGVIARIELEPQNPTFVVDNVGEAESVIIAVILYDANNNLILAETLVTVLGGGVFGTTDSSTTGGRTDVTITSANTGTGIVTFNVGAISVTTTVTAVEIANIGFTGIRDTNTDSPIIITISATDSAGDAIDINELGVTTDLAGAAILTATHQITYIPSIAGAETISITSINGLDVSSLSGISAVFSVTIAPAFTSIPITAARVGSLYRYRLTASDDDSANLVFGVAPGVELPSWLAIDAVVTTFSGSGIEGNVDDSFNSVRFGALARITVDSSGNIVVVDASNNRIRSIDANGAVTTIAGGGSIHFNEPGFVDATGTAARFDNPRGVAIDASGNIIIADSNNHRIRSISAGGVVSTIAGGGLTGTANGSFADGDRDTARFNRPTDVAIDASGNIIVADSFNSRIRSITQQGTVTTIAGSQTGFFDGASATARFSSPLGVEIDDSGNIIVADGGSNHRVRRITPDGTVSTIAGGVEGFANGIGSDARFDTPHDSVIDAGGNIIVSDRLNHRIRSIAPDRTVSTIAGTGPTGPFSSGDFADGVGAMARFNRPIGVAIDASGNIIVADTGNFRIRKIDRNNLVGTPLNCDDIGIYSATIIVSDGMSQDLQSFDIVVADDGNCGVIPTNLALSTTTIDESIDRDSVIAHISADNNNPASLSFSIVGGADRDSFEIGGGSQLIINHKPDFETQSSYEIIIAVSDGIHLVTKAFNINVNDVTPVFTSVPMVTVTRVSSLYQYNLSTRDGDNTNLIFSAAPDNELPSWLTISTVVTTLAGDGLSDDDDGATSTASFSLPIGVAIDAVGNIIVADATNNRIRSIDSDGMVRTVAGSSRGFADGASSTAQFNFPTDVAIDAVGNIIVADFANHRIRSISPSGAVRTIAGSDIGFADGASSTAQFRFPTDVAIDSVGNIIVADRDNHRIRRISADGMVTTVAGSGVADFADGASNTAGFNSPTGVAIDAVGNIIVADATNNRIRSIDSDGMVRTVAGSDNAGLSDGIGSSALFDMPSDVAIDFSGNIIVADRGNHRIRSIGSDDVVTTISGGFGFADGASAIARFDNPRGVAIDVLGNIIVADTSNNRIRKIDRNNIALVGTPSCGDIGFYNLAIMVSDGAFQDLQSFNVAVADDGSCGAIPTNLALSSTTIDENILADSVIATISADDNNPASLSFSIVGGADSASFSISDGNQLVIDHSPDLETQNSYEVIIAVDDTLHIVTRSFRIDVFDIERFPVFTSDPITRTRVDSLYQYSLSASDSDSANLVFRPAPDSELPSWLAIGAVVSTIAGSGTLGFADGASFTAGFHRPRGITIDTSSGDIIVADSNNHRIRRISPDGSVRTIAGNGIQDFADGASATAMFAFPTDVVIDASGNIIVADQRNHRIRSISADGTVTTIAGSGTSGFADGASATAMFDSLESIAIDASGNIIVADSGNRRIRKITPDDMVSTIAGSSTSGFADGASATAMFFAPRGIAIDASGNIIVADQRNHRIRSISADGTVTTIAGSGTSGFADGASATARFNNPFDVAVDASGNIIIVDSRNHRIRSIALGGEVTTIAGAGAVGAGNGRFADGTSGAARFDTPTGVVIDLSGDIIIADSLNHRIRRISNNNFVLAGTPDCDDVGIHDLAVIVSDGEFQDLQSFDIIVADDGSCGAIPTNLALSDTAISENILADSVIATISADDNNPASLSFSIVGGADSASFSISDGNQLVIDHSPDIETQDSYEIIIAVSDFIHRTTKTFNISVNNAPAFTSIPMVTTTRVGGLYRYALSARDTDSASLVFNAAPGTELPGWLNIGLFVSTLAGDGVAGSDDGATNTASFNFPGHVVIDASGNVVVADTSNHRIRRITPEGVSTVAGSSVQGFRNGASAEARFAFPRGVAIDAGGNIIVADQNNNLIRSITPGGTVTTIAGDDAGLRFGSTDGTGTMARFWSPAGVAIDAGGNIIVADLGSFRIRSIATNLLVSTIAGSSRGFTDGASATAQFDRPRGVAIDTSGNIIVADDFNHRIRSIASDGTVITIAGSETGFADGAGATAQFNTPRGVAIDTNGNIIVADMRNNSIRSVTSEGTVTTIATGFNRPAGVAIDFLGGIVVADTNNHLIRKIDRNNLMGTPRCDDIGIYNLAIIVSDGRSQDLQSFDIAVADDGSCGLIPTNLALSTTTIGENILADSVIATISADDSDNPASLSFSIVGGADGASFSISGDNQLVIDHSPNFEAQNSYEIIIAVSDVIHRTTKTFNIIVDNAPAFTSAPITRAIVDGLYRYNLSASDSDSSNLVFSVDPDTELPSWLTTVDTFVTTLAGSSFGGVDGASATAQFNSPTGVAIDASGNIIIADRNNHRIRSIASDGTVTTIAGDGTFGFTDGASATAQFNNPTGITIDTSGNIIIADRDNHSIRSIDSDGMVRTIAGDGTFGSTNGASATAQFNSPTGVAIDASGNIVVADSSNNRIRSISPNGMVSTIAGGGVFGHNDGASATARFSSPQSVAIDASGNIVIADRSNHQIRGIDVNDVVSTIAGEGARGIADGASATAEFNFPQGVAIDTSGNIIVADTLNHRIRSISLDGIVTTIAGSGPSGPNNGSFADGISSNARFSELFGIVIDASDNIIVADEDNHRIRKIERNSFILVGTPSCSDVGNHNLALIVSDGRSQSLQNFNIFVAEDGNCDTAPTNLALSTTTIDENILAFSIIATISADDSDNPGSLTFGIVGGADSANFRIDNGNQLVINQSPDFETQSSYEIIIGVSDILNPLVTTTFNIDVNQIIIDTTTNIVANSPYLRNLIGISTEGDRVGFSVAEGSNLPQWLALGSLLTRDNDNNSFAGQDFSGGTARPAFVDIDNDGDFDVFVGDFESLMFFENTGSSTTPSFSQANNPLNLDAINNDIAPAPAFVDIDNDGDFDAFVGLDFGNIIFAENTGSSTTPTFLTTSSNPFGFRDVAGSAAPAFVDIDNDGDFDAFVGAFEGSGTISTITFFENTGSVSSPSFSQVSGASNPLNIVNIDDAFEYKPAFVDIDSDGDFDVFVGVDIGGVIFFENIGSATSALFTRGADFYDLLTAPSVDDGVQFAPSFVDIDGDGDNDVFVGRNIGAIADIVFYRNIPAVLTGTPECSDLGPDVLTLTINDGISTSGQSFDIRVISDGSCALVAPFNFGAISDVIPNTIITSNAITVATNTQDPQSAFTISIEGSGARYSINDGIYTNIGRIVNVGDSVRVQIVASNQVITTRTATVSIDNVAATFAVTTADFMIAGGDRTVNYNSPPITITTTIVDIPIVWTSSATNVVSFSDPNIGLITIVGAGTALITAMRGDDEDSIVFTVEPLTLTPTFASPQSFIYNTNIRTVLVTITSGIIEGDDVSLSVSGATAADAGNYNIDLALIGTDSRNYFLSTTTLSWSIIRTDQSQFSLGADTTITFGEGLSRPATGVSATVASSYGSSNPNVATVAANGDITTTGIGSTIISTTNTGDNNYNSAADSYTLNVAPLTLTIAIGSTSTIYTGAAITITTTITNLVSGHEQVSLTINGDQTATNAGDYSFNISAIEGSDSPNYILIPTTISWVVASAQQSELDITGNATILMVGQTTIATAINNQPQGTLTISASEAGIVTIDGSTITANNVGITTITITKQVANHNDISASYQLVVIQNTTAAIDAGDDRTATYAPDGALSAQAPTNTQGRIISYAADPIDSDVATININTGAITITNAGTVSIIVSAAATTNYAASTDSYLLTINQAAQEPFTITASDTLIFGATSAIVVVDPGSGDGTITYDSSDIAIATIATDGIITATGAGEATITATRDGGRNYLDTSATHLLVVERADQVVSIIGGTLSIDYAPNGATTAGRIATAQTTITYSSTDEDVAIVGATSGIITIVNAGAISIVASATRTSGYNSAVASYQLIIRQVAQGPFSINASDTLIFGATSAVVIVDPGSGDGVVSYDSSNIAVITITADGIITAAGVGEAIITATRGGGRNYLNISATHSIIVERAEQADFVISGSSTLANAATSFATTTGGSGTGAIVFSSSNPDVATITQDGIITAQSLGTTTISATKSGGDNYHDIGDSYLLTIINTTPTVANPIANQIASFGNPFTFTIPANTFNDANGDDLAISVSTLPDGLIFDSTNTSITGIPATVGISIITITADDGNGATVSTSFSLEVTGRFVIIGENPRSAVYGDATQNIIAQGGASLTGAITFSSSTPSVASFDNANIGALTIVGAGTTIITATRDSTSEQTTITFTVHPRIITPTFASLSTFIYDTSIRTVLVTITSGIIEGDDISFTISGATTATEAGNYNIDLVLIGAASPNYRLNVDTLSWSIIRADQSAFSLGADTTIIFGEGLSRPATGVSATVASSYGSSDPDVATVDTNGDITTTGIGSTIISATNIGDNNYNSAADSYTLNVAPLTLTIAIGSTTTIYSGAAITVTTTITNLVSGHEQVSLTINGDQTATNAGDYSFDISAIEGIDSPNYILIPITISWTIDPAQQSELDITGNATRLMVGQTTIATATNDQPQGTLTISASEAGIVTIDGSTITASNVGTITITISKQVANHNDISASYQLVVVQNTTTPINAGDDRTVIYAPDGALSAQLPTNTQGRVISYAADPIDSDVATININTGAITITNAGTVSIVVSAAATTNYAASTDSYLLTINQAAQDLFTITASDTLIFGATSAIVVVDLGSGDGTITYSSSDIAIATVTTDGIITATGAGEATITATRDGGRNYLDTSATHLLVVERADQVVSIIGGTLSIDYAPDSATVVGRIATAQTAITYSSTDEDVAIVGATSGIITIANAGTISIVASATETNGYNSAVASYQLIIRQANQGPFSITASDTLAFGTTNSIVIVDPGSGEGTVTYSVSPSGIITIDIDGIISAVGIGQATITATKAGGRNYFSTSAIHLLTVERADQIVSIAGGTLSIDYAPGSATAIGRTATAQTTITYSSSDEDVAIVGATSAIITIVNAGTISIIASASEADNYNSATASYVLIVNPIDQTGFEIELVGSTLEVGETTTVTATGGQSDSTITFSFISTINNILDIDETSGIIVAMNSGTALIIATREGGRNYNDVSVSALLEVVARFSLDVDGDGRRLTTTDGILIIRYLTASETFTTTGATTTDATIDAQTIENNLKSAYNDGILDIDGDGDIEVDSDGRLIMRYLADQENLNIDGLVGAGAARSDAQEISEHLGNMY